MLLWGAVWNGIQLSPVWEGGTGGRLCETRLPSHRDGLQIALNLMPFRAVWNPARVSREGGIGKRRISNVEHCLDLSDERGLR